MFRQKLKSEAGYSITEVLVTITIVGIVLGIAAMVWTSATNNSNDQDATNRLEKAHKAAYKDLVENDGRYSDPSTLETLIPKFEPELQAKAISTSGVVNNWADGDRRVGIVKDGFTTSKLTLVTKSKSGKVFVLSAEEGAPPIIEGFDPEDLPGPPVDTYKARVLASAPIAYYRLDEKQGPTAYDKAGLTPAIDGLYSTSGAGSFAYSQDSLVPQSENSSIRIDDNNSTLPKSITASDHNRLDFNQNWTLELWIKTPSSNPGSFRTLLRKGSAYALAIRADNKLALYINGNSTPFATSSVALEPNRVYHIAAGRNGGNNKFIYLNNSNVTTDTASISADLANNSQPLQIAAGDASSYGWSGGIDEVALYNKALNASDLEDHYKSGTGAGAPFIEYSGISASDITQNSAKITANIAGSIPSGSKSFIRYGIVSGSYEKSESFLAQVGNNVVSLSNLQSDQRYYVKAMTYYGNEVVVSEEINFLTPAEIFEDPETTINSGPPSLTNNSNASFQFSSDQGTATFKCKLGSGSWFTCSSPQAFSSLAEGTYTFQVKAVRPPKEDQTPATRTWTVDTTAPAAPTISGIPGQGTVVNLTSASFSFTAEAGATFECRLLQYGSSLDWTNCSSPRVYSNISEGPVNFQVRATDGAGNIGPAAERTWTVDTTGPTTTITSGPAQGSVATSTSASFGFTSSEAGSSFQCRLLQFGSSLDWTNCSSPRAYSGISEGAANFQVRATDAAGNVGPEAQRTWTVNASAPTLTITGGPANGAAINTSATAYTVSSNEPVGASYQCSMVAFGQPNNFIPCNYNTTGHLIIGLTEGYWTFAARTIDAGGSVSPIVSRLLLVDFTPPTVTINSGPAEGSSTSSTSASFSFTSEAGATFECRLLQFGSSLDWTNCSSPRAYSGLSEGPANFQVRATDTAGNVSAIVQRTWTVAIPPPVPTISGTPAQGAVTNSTSASFSFTSEAGATFECRLLQFGSSLDWTNCSSPRAYSSILEGAVNFQVRAKDSFGNYSAEAQRTWTVDLTAPTTTITSGPAQGSYSNSGSPTFGFSSSEAGSSFQCRVVQYNDPPWSSCTSPRSYSGLADGDWAFQVRSIDPAGNVGAAAGRNWSIDTVAPVSTITSGPTQGSVTTSRSATFTFSASSGGSATTTYCRLIQGDSPAWEVCSGSKSYTNLSDGVKAFQVATNDAAGNFGSADTRSWTIDTTPPPVPTISGTPAQGSATNSTSASFSFTSEAGATFECRLLQFGSSLAWTSCSSPRAYSGISEGDVNFQVRARDAVGNYSAEAQRTWLVDTTPPTTTLTSGPAEGSISASRNATFTFSASSGGSTATTYCRLVQWDNPAWEVCSGSKSYTNLSDGAKVFQVATNDAAGNFGPVISRSWTVDATAPVASIIGGPVNGAAINTTSTGYTVASNEPSGATYQCSIAVFGQPNNFTACNYNTTGHIIVGLSDGYWTFATRVFDAAGNVSAVVSYLLLVDTIAPVSTINSGPANGSTTTSRSATFTFSASSGGSATTTYCRLVQWDNPPWEVCSGSRSYSGLSTGVKVFQVGTNDSAGNIGAVVSRSWTIQ